MSHLDDYEYAPGTVRILDPDNLEAAQTSKDVLVLVPPPSTDVNDPLNWSFARKTLSLVMLMSYTITTCLTGGALYAIYAPMVEQTGLTYAQLNEGVGYVYFTFGIGSLFFMPLAVVIGKRPVYIISLLGQAAITVWAAYTKGNGQWVVNRILLGLFSAPNFTLVAVSVADLYFLHQRGFYMGIYMMLLYVGPLLAPILGSGIYSGTNFKMVLILCGGLCVINAIFCFVLMEETNYVRELPIPGPPATETPSMERMGMDDDVKEVHGTKSHAVHTVLDVPYEGVATTEHRQLEGQTMSFVQRMRFQKVRRDAKRVFFRGVVQPLWAAAVSPIIWFGAFQYGMYQVIFNIGNAWASITLSAPPYNFSPLMVGITYFGAIAVTIPVALVSGTLADKLTVYFAKRNHGISEPEHKLWLTLPLFIVSPFGLLMMGLGAYYQLHWIVFVIGTSVAIGLGPLATLIIVNYLFDSYQGFARVGDSDAEAAPHFIGSVILAMFLTLGFNYSFTPWLTNLGYKVWGITAAVVFVVVPLTVMPVIKYGKGMRRRGQKSYQRVLDL